MYQLNMAKTNTLSLQNLTTFSLIVIIVLLLFRQCGQGERINQLLSINHEQSVRIDKEGKKITTQTQNILRLEDALKLEILEKENYMKSIESQVKVGVSNVVTGKKVVYHDTIEKLVYVDTMDDEIYDEGVVFIKVPFTLQYNDTWTLLQATIGEDDFTIDSLITKTDLRVTLGYEKQGWFKSPKPIVEIKSENPNTEINIKSNVVIKEPKPFYKRTWFGVLVGSIGTFILMK